MLRSRLSGAVGTLIVGFILGISLMLVMGVDEAITNHKKTVSDNEKTILEPGVFGDIRISISKIEDVEAKDVLTVFKGEYPFFLVYKNPNGEVFGFALADGNEGILALSNFNKGRIADFVVYGNKVHDNKRMPVFFLEASETHGVWHKVRYSSTSRAIRDGDKVMTYKIIGEVYIDIDFDGEFDARQLWDKDSKIVSESIFVNGRWLELSKRTSNGDFTKLGHIEIEKSEAFTVKDNKKVYYDFEFGKGWKKRVE